ncbi:MAG TPA: alpha/beta fold hydrolase, partial [Cellvibrio sp.]
ELAAAFPDKAIYAMNYRGFGGSDGTPSEEGLVKDAFFLFDHIRKNHRDIIVIGRSLGSGIAVQLASKRQVHRLILVTPYDSIQNIAAGRFPAFPVRWLLKDKFESWRYAAKISAPTTVIAAEFDEVIPLKNTRNLLDSFPQGIATLIVVHNTGHNSISGNREYINALRSQQ